MIFKEIVSPKIYILTLSWAVETGLDPRMPATEGQNPLIEQS